MIRLFLFDVDGTLVSARGAGREAMRRALAAVYGVTGPIVEYDFRGKTDPGIVFDLLGSAGLSMESVEGRLGRFFDRYAEDLRTEIRARGGVDLMPGVADLVPRLTQSDETLVGLLTGNIEAGARIKLEPTGLLPHFCLGAFGSDARDRDQLPSVAVVRAEALTGKPISPDQVVVIGDTPLDIACARAFGARVVSVATGGHQPEELASHRPDLLFRDLSDVSEVLGALLEGLSGG